MSRGLGSVQRAIVEQLEALRPGMGVLVGDGGWSTRRAVRGLERRQIVTLERKVAFGRVRLVARLRAETRRV